MATTSKLVELFNALADASLTEATATAFVEAAYENLLGLSGDFSNKEARVAYWVAQIEGGVSRADFASTFLAAGTVQGDLLTDAEFAANGVVLAALEALDETDLTLESVKAAAVAAAEEAAEEEEEEANAGETFTLTTSTDSVALTSGDDTVSAAAGTLASADVIIDSLTTDNDTANLTVTTAGLTPTIAKVENVNVNGEYVTTGLDLTNVTAVKTLTVSTNIASGTATVAAAKTAAAEEIVAGSNITTLNVTAAATGTGGNLAIDAGSASTVALTAASAADTATITTNGTVSVTGAAAIETMTLNAAAASTVTIDGVGTSLDVAGSNDVTLKATAVQITGEKVTKSSTGNLTVNITATGVADLSQVAADEITLSAALNNTLTTTTGSVVNAALDQTTLDLTQAAATATTNAVTFNNTAATQTSITSTNVKTLTINSAAKAVAGVDATYADINAGTNNVVLTGTNDVKVTLGEAGTADASALVGALTYIQDAAAATTVKGGSGANSVTLKATTQDVSYVGQDGGDTVSLATTTGTAVVQTGSGVDTVTANAVNTGVLSANLGAGDDTISATSLSTGTASLNLGAGDDTVTFGTAVGAATIVVDGGEGTDVVKFGNGADISTGTLSLTGVETIQLTATGAMTFSAAQMSGMDYTIKGTGTLATDILTVNGVAATTAIDLSGLAFDNTVATAMQKTTIDASAATGSVTITGSSAYDAITVSGNGDTIVIAAGGSGKTGNGTDDTETKIDSITSFVSGTDKLSLGVAGDATANTGNYVEVAATGYANIAAVVTAANTALATLNSTSSATQLYAMLGETTGAADTVAGGYLAVDNNSDGVVDMLISLVGVNETAFAATDIIA